MPDLSPSAAAHRLLRSLSLPRGAATVMAQHEDSRVIMHVLVDHHFVNRVPPLSFFEGYEVIVKERQPVRAL